jgi:hypothetical protein
MIALAVAAWLAAAPEANDLTTRMRDSAAAAQALEGPLDGAWTLWAGDRPLYVFQITDPAGGAGPLGGAWRRTGVSASAGPIDAIVLRGDRLAIRFAADGVAVGVRLRRRPSGAWSGEVNQYGRPFPAALRPTAPGATAP